MAKKKVKTCNLVLAGGGVKGIALVGAIEELQNAGYTFRRVAGTSAGAVVGGLLAAGYNAEELKQIMRDTPYEKFKDKSPIDYFGIPGKALSLFFEKGIYEGDYFCNWYEELLAQKNINTFGDLKIDDDYRLTAIAANITRGKLLRFPTDLTNLGVDIDSQQISRAVRASISIPFFYEPVSLNGDYLVDGGILSNYPIDTFSDDKIPTIGIKLSAEPGAIDKPHNITGAWSYAGAIIGTMLSVQDQIHLNDPDAIARTIFVDTGDIMATDFGITEAEQQFLYEAGKTAAIKYLDSQ